MELQLTSHNFESISIEDYSEKGKTSLAHQSSIRLLRMKNNNLFSKEASGLAMKHLGVQRI